LGLAAAADFRKVCSKKEKEAAWSSKSQSTISRSVQQNTLLSELSPSAAARQRAQTCSCGMGFFKKISGEIEKTGLHCDSDKEQDTGDECDDHAAIV
jgi:hypothetical protein